MRCSTPSAPSNMFDALTPFVPLTRWFEDAFQPTGTERMLAPPLDVAETEHGFRVTTELPGLSKADVTIQFENGVLTISGEKKQEEKTEGVDWHRVERRFGSFRRSVSLPRGATGENAKASFENGVLTVEIPKREEVKPRSIQIS